MDPISELAVAAGAGDRVALERFVRATQPDVWRLAANLVDRNEADDLTQEVYERALRGLSSFRGESSARTWLMSIARRTCVDAIRRRTRVRTRDERLKVLASERAESIDGALELDEALGTLEDDRRSAFVLTQLLGYSYQEAAEVCGCPVGTIRSRVARARGDLIAAWVDDEDAPTSSQG